MKRELIWMALEHLADTLEAEAKAWRAGVMAEKGGNVEEILDASAVIVCLQRQRIAAHDAAGGALGWHGAEVLAGREAEKQADLARCEDAEMPF